MVSQRSESKRTLVPHPFPCPVLHSAAGSHFPKSIFCHLGRYKDFFVAFDNPCYIQFHVDFGFLNHVSVLDWQVLIKALWKLAGLTMLCCVFPTAGI